MQLDFKNYPLLLVGRDPDMLGLLREVLLDAGFTVRAKLIEGFLSNIHLEDRAAMVIYDETQPELDAERIFYVLQEHSTWKSVPFMLLSDVYNGARIARCLDRGVAEFVDKPFDVDELGGRIRKVLREEREDALLMEQLSQYQIDDGGQEEGFSGDLSFMGLPDLLMNLFQNQRTGVLEVTMEDGEYNFSFKKGRMVYVSGPAKMQGLKAFNRAIRVFYGRFAFVPQDEKTFKPKREKDYGELPNLVLSAVQESDEFPLTRTKLPPEPILVRLSEAPDTFSGDIRILKPLLQNPSREGTIDELIKFSPKTDLDAAIELLEMFESGMLVEV